VKKIILFGCIFLLILTSLTQISSSNMISGNNTIYVDDDGTSDYTRIQDAIDNASDGDTIFVYNGTYYENIIIDKAIRLIGEDRYSCIIEYDRQQDINVILIESSKVTIYNFTIQNSVYRNGNGIFTKSNRINISGNIIINNSMGIYILYGDNNFIYRNNISNNHNGIYIVGDYLFGRCSHNEIKENYISNNEFGIGAIICLNNKVIGNTFKNNIYSDYVSIISNFDYFYGNCFLSNSPYYKGILIHGRFNRIINNNFLTNLSEPSFRTLLAPPFNIWHGNYWNETLSAPKKITGEIFMEIPSGYDEPRKISWDDYDWNPAKEPYDIPTPEANIR